MKKVLYFLIFFPAILCSQIHYYEKGDTLTVLAKNGLVLRDDHSINSNKILQLSFGEKVKVIDTLYFGDYIDERHGSWIHVQAKDKTGYMFSGYLTQLKIPTHFTNEQNCWRFEQFEEIIKFNIGSLVCKGEREFKSFWEKSSGSTTWELYDDGTIIENSFSYEYADLIVHSYNLTMFDVLNLLDNYIQNIPKDCGEIKNYEVKVTKTDSHAIESIECYSLRFSAKNTCGWLVIVSNLFDL